VGGATMALCHWMSRGENLRIFFLKLTGVCERRNTFFTNPPN
jgi:hypothetical protein